MSVLVDTNIVLRLKGVGHPTGSFLAQTLSRLREGGEHVCVSSQSIVEAWAVLTRPIEANGVGLEPRHARLEIERILSAFALAPDPANLFPTWLELCTTHEVRGRQVYDARLVAFMIASGMRRLVTLNLVDFTRYDMIEVIDPARLA